MCVSAFSCWKYQGTITYKVQQIDWSLFFYTQLKNKSRNILRKDRKDRQKEIGDEKVKVKSKLCQMKSMYKKSI